MILWAYFGKQKPKMSNWQSDVLAAIDVHGEEWKVDSLYIICHSKNYYEECAINFSAFMPEDFTLLSQGGAKAYIIIL